MGEKYSLTDPAKAKRELCWEPKVRFKTLVELMVVQDIALAERESQIDKLPKN